MRIPEDPQGEPRGLIKCSAPAYGTAQGDFLSGLSLNSRTVDVRRRRKEEEKWAGAAFYGEIPPASESATCSSRWPVLDDALQSHLAAAACHLKQAEAVSWPLAIAVMLVICRLSPLIGHHAPSDVALRSSCPVSRRPTGCLTVLWSPRLTFKADQRPLTIHTFAEGAGASYSCSPTQSGARAILGTSTQAHHL